MKWSALGQHVSQSVTFTPTMGRPEMVKHSEAFTKRDIIAPKSTNLMQDARSLTSDGRFHLLDLIVFATGFDASEGAFNVIDFLGQGGVSLREHWKPHPEVNLVSVIKSSAGTCGRVEFSLVVHAANNVLATYRAPRLTISLICSSLTAQECLSRIIHQSAKLAAISFLN